jgi:hypothetical protein
MEWETQVEEKRKWEKAEEEFPGTIPMCDPRAWFDPQTQRPPGREEGRKQDRIGQLGIVEGGPRDTRLWSWRQDDRRCEAEKEQDRQANAFLRAINDEQRRAIITHIAHTIWDIRWALMEEDMHCRHRGGRHGLHAPHRT